MKKCRQVIFWDPLVKDDLPFLFISKFGLRIDLLREVRMSTRKVIFLVRNLANLQKKMASFDSAPLSHVFFFSRGIDPAVMIGLLMLLLSLPKTAVARAALTHTDPISPSAQQQTTFAGFELSQHGDLSNGSFSRTETMAGIPKGPPGKDIQKVAAQYGQRFSATPGTRPKLKSLPPTAPWVKGRARDLQHRPQRQASDVIGSASSWADGDGQWISHLCAAQCDACTLNTEACQTPCRDSRARKTWTTICPTHQHEYQDFNELEQAYQTIDVGCPGTCNILRNQNDASYFIPMTPEIVLVRDMRNRSVTLTWSRPGSSEPVVYVVQEREQNGLQGIRRWTAAHLVMGGDHFTRYNLDVCSTPVYRVAAVSRFGARWFSREVVTPVITPEKPQMFRITGSAFNPDFNEFTIEVAWETPRGFTLKDLRPGNPYTFQGRALCGGRMAPEVFVEETHYGDLDNSLTFHMVDEVIGCTLVLVLTAASSCDDRLESEPSYLRLNFSCVSVQGFYSGNKCTDTYEYVPPMNVMDVRVTSLPSGRGGARAHVTWSPPQDMGSEGRVDYYVVFYGIVNPIFSWGFNGSYGNMTVPGDILQADVAIPSLEDDSARFGILVMPGVNGHEIQYPIGIMHIVPRPTFSNGSALLEEEEVVVYYNQDAPESVQVFWSRPGPRYPPPPDPAGTALQWGRVVRRGVGDEAEGREGSNLTALGEGQVDWLSNASLVVLEGEVTTKTT